MRRILVAPIALAVLSGCTNTPTTRPSPSPAITCAAAGLIYCDGHCIDPSTDLQHCGAGAECGGVQCEAGERCVAGVCSLSCPPPLARCGDVCVDTEHDPDFCGSSTNVCVAPDGGLPVCSSGACDYLCAPDRWDCNQDPGDGCEVDLASDTSNCGVCGKVCLEGESCHAGRCELRITQDTDLSQVPVSSACPLGTLYSLLLEGGPFTGKSVTAYNAGAGSEPPAACLVGQKVLLYKLTFADLPDPGAYQLLTVESTNGYTINFKETIDPAVGEIGATAHSTSHLLLHVPVYTNFVVDPGVRVTTSVSGHTFLMMARESIQIDGILDMKGHGAAGGASPSAESQGGNQGQALGATAQVGTTPNAQGGGGGHGDSTCADFLGGGGGGAGYLNAGKPGSHCGGDGGIALNLPGTIYWGAGGGSGGNDNVLTNNPPGGVGGAGGGAILMWAPRIEVNGSIVAGGTDGQGDPVAGCQGGSTTVCWDYSGPGGGGAGGLVITHNATYVGNEPDVSGGLGGLGGLAGNGGDGSEGMVVHVPRSCVEAVRWDPGLADGMYTFDPDGNGPMPAATQVCDNPNN